MVIVYLITALFTTQGVFAQTCMEDAYGGNLNCTANDVSLAGVTTDIESCQAGELVTIDIITDIELSANERYDLAVYTALDGGDGLTGSCAVTSFPETLPFGDLEGSNDACGDLASANAPVQDYNLGTFTLLCEANESGNLAFSSCTSWQQNSTDTCDLVPGAPSKCKCQTVDLIDVQVLSSITIVKEATPLSGGESPQDFTFTATGIPTTTFVLDDDADGTLSNSATFTGLTAGTYTFTEADLVGWEVSSIECTDSSGASIGTVDLTAGTAEIPVTGDVVTCTYNNVQTEAASMSVSKSAAPATVSEPGGDVVYTVEIVNTSNINTITVNELDDTMAPASISCALPATLAPSETLTCEYTIAVSGDPSEVMTNTVTVTAEDDNGSPLVETDVETVEVLDSPSSMEVNKTAAPPEILEESGDVVYTVEIVNTSAVDDITINSLDDSMFPANVSCALPSTLAPTESLTCVYTETVTGTPGDIITNTVTVSAVDDDGVPLEESDSADVTILDSESSMSVNKTAAPATLVEPGGDVVYTVEIVNTSVVDDITIDSLADTMSPASISCVLPAVLSPGDSLTCEYTINLSGSAGDVMTNTVTVSATDDDGNPLEETAVETVEISEPPVPSMSINKTATPPEILEESGEVVYTVEIVNTSSVNVITVTQLADTMNPPALSCALPAILVPSESITCAYTMTVSGQANETITNTVTVTAVDNNGTPLVETDEETILVNDVPSGMEVNKTAAPTEILEESGEVVYTVSILNTSPVDDITITQLDDTMLPATVSCALPATLGVGETLTCIYTETVTGEPGDVITNTVTVSATDDDGQPLEESDDADVTILDAQSSMSVNKTAAPITLFEPGGDVVYTVEIINTSTVDDITITDLDDTMSPASISCPLPSTLAPSENLICTYTINLSGSAGDVMTNTVTVSATDDDGGALNETSDASVEILPEPVPSMSINKTAAPTEILEESGDVVYTVEIVNTSSANVITVTQLIDTMSPPTLSCVLPAVLAPGGLLTCAYTVTISGEAGDVMTNTVTVSATADDGTALEETDDAIVTLLDVPSSMSVNKTAAPSIIPEPGGDVVYTVDIVNTSSVDDITITDFDDTMLPATISCALPATLAPSQTLTCVYTETVTGTPGELIMNTVTVSATDDDGNDLDGSDSAVVEIDQVESSMAVNKTADPASIASPGGDVVYTVEIINTSSVDTITVTTLTDSQSPPSTSCTLPASLAPSENLICEYTINVTGVDGDLITNTVTVDAIDDDGETLDESDIAVVTITELPSISVNKTSVPAIVPEPGGTVTYTIEIINTSETLAVTINSIDDSLIPDGVDCGLPVTLAQSGIGGDDVVVDGTRLTCTYTTTVTGQPGDVITNTVTVNATGGDGTPLEEMDEATVTISDLASSMSVNKTADPVTVPEPGGTVTYTVEIVNTSSVDDITITQLDDTMSPANISCTLPATLAVGETLTCTYVEAVSGDPGDVITNTVTVSATDDDGIDLVESDDADVTVTDDPSSFTVNKTAAPTTIVAPSGDVVYTVEIINTSSVDDITITQLNDTMSPATLSCALPATLAPTEVLTCVYTETVTTAAMGGEITNTVTVSATDDDGNDLIESDDAIVTALSSVPSMAVNKTAVPASVPESGGDVVYTVEIINTSALVDITINQLDDSLSPSNLSCTLPITLAPSASTSCVYTLTLSGMPGETITNTVTITATDENGDPLEESDSETIIVDDVPSSISVVKTADVATISEPGGVVTYTVAIANTSAADAVTINELDDSLVPNGLSCTLPTTLGVGESVNCTYTTTITGDPGDLITNTVIITGTDDDGEPVDGTDETTVTITDDPASMSVNKTASPATLITPGGDVVYTIEIVNTSNVDDITITALDDTMAPAAISCALPTTLAPTEMLTCVYTETITSTVIGEVITNTVTVSATDDDGNDLTESDDEDVIIQFPPSSIAVNKTAAPATVLESGGTVTYTIEIVNTSPSVDVTINELDDSLAPSSISCTLPITLAPGAGTTCVYALILSGMPGDIITNTVTITATDENGNPLDESDSETVEVVDEPSSISVVKTADIATVSEPGGVVTYTIAIVNTSAADAVTISELDDSLVPNGLSCTLPTTLGIGESVNCTYTTTITGDPGDLITNTVIITGTDDDGETVGGTDETTVEVTDDPSSMSVNKTAAPVTVLEPGGDVVYTVEIVNTSNVDDITITDFDDTMLPANISCALPVTLGVDESVTCVYTETVTGNPGDMITNTVTVGATDDDGGTLEESDDAKVTIDNSPSSFAVIKTATPMTITEEGDDVTYSVIIENTSDVDDITITEIDDSVDPAALSCTLPITLAPAETVTCSYTVFVSGEPGGFTNVVTVTVTDDDGDETSETTDKTVTITDTPSSIAVSKVATPASIISGGTVTYTVFITNTSTVDSITLNNVNDSMLPATISCPLPTVLAPSESTTCVYALPVSGNVGDVITNTVTVEATDDDGVPLTGTDTATVTIKEECDLCIHGATKVTIELVHRDPHGDRYERVRVRTLNGTVLFDTNNDSNPYGHGGLFVGESFMVHIPNPGEEIVITVQGDNHHYETVKARFDTDCGLMIGDQSGNSYIKFEVIEIVTDNADQQLCEEHEPPAEPCELCIDGASQVTIELIHRASHGDRYERIRARQSDGTVLFDTYYDGNPYGHNGLFVGESFTIDVPNPGEELMITVQGNNHRHETVKAWFDTDCHLVVGDQDGNSYIKFEVIEIVTDNADQCEGEGASDARTARSAVPIAEALDVSLLMADEVVEEDLPIASFSADYNGDMIFVDADDVPSDYNGDVIIIDTSDTGAPESPTSVTFASQTAWVSSMSIILLIVSLFACTMVITRRF